jgi:hypothetical protein
VSASEWSEVEDFINENLMTDDRITKEYESGRKVGEEQTRNAIKARLLDKAADKFKVGKDDEARQLRELAIQI